MFLNSKLYHVDMSCSRGSDRLVKWLRLGITNKKSQCNTYDYWKILFTLSLLIIVYVQDVLKANKERRHLAFIKYHIFALEKEISDFVLTRFFLIVIILVSQKYSSFQLLTL